MIRIEPVNRAAKIDRPILLPCPFLMAEENTPAIGAETARIHVTADFSTGTGRSIIIPRPAKADT